MTAPIGTHIRKGFEPVRDTVVQLFLLRIRLCVRLAYTFGDNFGVAFLVASVLAVLTLHASRVLKEISAKSTTHDIVKLLKHEFVPIQLVDLFFTLTDSPFTVKANVEWSPIFDLLLEAQSQLNPAYGLQSEPCINVSRARSIWGGTVWHSPPRRASRVPVFTAHGRPLVQ